MSLGTFPIAVGTLSASQWNQSVTARDASILREVFGNVDSENIQLSI